MRMKGSLLYLAFLIPLFLCAACGSSKHITRVTLSGVTLSASSASVAAGKTTQITVTVVYSNQTRATNPAGVTFTSSDATIAVVGANGVVTTLKPGTTTITATYQGISGSTTVTVTAAVMDSFSLSQINISLANGLTKTISLSGTMTDGSAVADSLFASCTWTSSGGVATLSGTTGKSNTLTAAGVGSGTLSITCSGITESTTVTVTAAEISRINLTSSEPTIDVGGTSQFTATATLTDGTTKNVTSTAVWASGTTTVATMDTTTAGLVHGVAAGSSTITATENGVSGTSLLTVANTATNAASFVYATSYDFQTSGWLFTTYDVSADGTFTPRDNKPFNSSWGRMALAGTRFLYLEPYNAEGPNDPRPGNQITGYSIDQHTGNLTPLPVFTPSGTRVGSLSIDPSGKWMLAIDQSDYATPSIRVFSIDQGTGALSDTGLAYSLPGFTYPTSNNVTGFAKNANGTFFYFGTSGGHCATYGGSGPCTALYAYSVDSATGGMSALPGSPYQSWANSPQTFALAINGSGSVLWLSFDAYRIVTFSLDASTGVPSQLHYWWPEGSGAPIQSMAVHDSYFYAGQGSTLLWIKPDPVTQALGASVWSYTNDPDNTGGAQPLDIKCLALDDAYNHLFVADETGISTFNLDNTGQPAPSKRITTTSLVWQMIAIPRNP
jgi:Bacterial Ig-like domain (group 2)/Lactonase, 7-bladed beta-propeller